MDVVQYTYTYISENNKISVNKQQNKYRSTSPLLFPFFIYIQVNEANNYSVHTLPLKIELRKRRF